MKRWIAFAAALLAGAAFAQDWPAAPVRVVVPYGPGSTPDIVARLVAEKLGPRLGKPVIVENKPGAAGHIGTDAVARAVPDGHTIGLSIAGPLGVNTLLYRKMPYDPASDLAPISLAATQPSVLVASARMEVASTAQLLEKLKANPGKYNYTSMGGGSISHLAMEALAARSGTQLVHVPYSGSGPAVMAVLSGDVDVACLPAAAVMAHVKAGKLKALAVATEKRSPVLPDVPTLAEAGLRDVYADAWMGFVAPARTPPAVVRRLRDEIAAVLGEPDVRARLQAQYMEAVGGTPEHLRATLEADLRRWKPVIEKNRIALD